MMAIPAWRNCFFTLNRRQVLSSEPEAQPPSMRHLLSLDSVLAGQQKLQIGLVWQPGCSLNQARSLRTSSTEGSLPPPGSCDLGQPIYCLTVEERNARGPVPGGADMTLKKREKGDFLIEMRESKLGGGGGPPPPPKLYNQKVPKLFYMSSSKSRLLQAFLKAVAGFWNLGRLEGQFSQSAIPPPVQGDAHRPAKTHTH